MTPPFRVGVMQLTMEPLNEMLAAARALEEALTIGWGIIAASTRRPVEAAG